MLTGVKCQVKYAEIHVLNNFLSFESTLQLKET